MKVRKRIHIYSFCIKLEQNVKVSKWYRSREKQTFQAFDKNSTNITFDVYTCSSTNKSQLIQNAYMISSLRDMNKKEKQNENYEREEAQIDNSENKIKPRTFSSRLDAAKQLSSKYHI